MIRATGGSAFGATSTRSRPRSSATLRASSVLKMPSWAPSSSTKRTRAARMRSLTLGSDWLIGGHLSRIVGSGSSHILHAPKHDESPAAKADRARSARTRKQGTRSHPSHSIPGSYGGPVPQGGDRAAYPGRGSRFHSYRSCEGGREYTGVGGAGATPAVSPPLRLDEQITI